MALWRELPTSPISPYGCRSWADQPPRREGSHLQPGGHLDLQVSHEGAQLIASSFLAADDGTVADHRVADVICELTNVVCGNLMSSIASASGFSLASPELIRRSSPEALHGSTPEGPHTVHYEESFQLERGWLTLRLALADASRMRVPKTRVLIVDDSAIARRFLTDMLSGQPDIEVIATAPDPYVAREKILELKPDVLTLDLEMPRMDGISFLKRLMHFHPLPVVVISSTVHSGSDAALEALRLGAVEVLRNRCSYSVEDLGEQVVHSVRAAARARIKGRRDAEESTESPPPALQNLNFSSNALVGIGASTGGVEAIREVLVQIPAHFPPILVVQHLPRAFLRSLVEQLNRACFARSPRSGETNELVPGRVLIAPGERHMEVRYSGAKRAAVLTSAPPVNRHRPSVDVLFRSMAKTGARTSVGVLLTGMGSDGAEGLLALRQGGAATIAQDQRSSVVYGMPGEAVRLGAAEVVLPLKDIASGIMTATAPASRTNSINT